MRTMLDLDERLLAAAQRRAEEEGVTLSVMVERALNAALGPPPTGASGYRFEWKTHKGPLLPGVDLGSRDALFDVLERRRS